MKALTLCALLTPFAALAASPFDGTWVSKDESQVMDKKPFALSLDKGIWESHAQVPAIKVKADGTDQAVKGHAAYDTVAVKVASADTVDITVKKGGKVMGTNAITVSGDGKMLTNKWNDQSGSEAASGEITYERVGAGHGFSGSWRALKTQNTSANARTLTWQSTADGMSFSTPTGQSYTAKFDGKEVPIAGDPSGTTVSLKKVSASAIVETDHQMGKVVEVDHWNVAADGKTMKIDWERKDSGRKGSVTFEKQ